MSVVVVVLLGGLWALILLPGAWRDSRHGSPLNSIDAFEQSMSRLAPPRTPPGGHVVVLGRPDRVGLQSPGLQSPTLSAPLLPPRERSGPIAAAPAPRGPSPQMLMRRRQVLAVLGAATAVTGVLGLWLGGFAWVVFVLAYAALFGYVALLVQLRARRDEARDKLRYLAPPPVMRPLTSGVRIRTARGA